nr:hypothetical protein [Tanacetum cinerariifolium]
MENKPNVAGSGPAWLFDIDSLTRTMNYHPVIAENQSNSHVGLQDTEKLGEEVTHIYKSASPDIHSSSSGPQTRKQSDKTENKDKGKSSVFTITGFRDLNAEFEECTNNSSNGVNAASSLVSIVGHNIINSTNDISADDPSNTAASLTIVNFDDSDMPNLEDLTHSDDADDVGAEADINNLESIIPVNPIPTTIIHKDHPTSQIIGDLSSTTQTKSMAKAVRDQELLQFKLQKVWILVDLPYGKRAIGTKWVYRNKKDERGIVIKNKARLVAQGHTQEKGIDYEETRSMARAVRDQGGLSQMFNEDFHTCMFSCFLSQEEPTRVHQALKDLSWIEAMQEELLQFKMQKVWILVDLPYEKRAIGTKWVYRNKRMKKA